MIVFVEGLAGAGKTSFVKRASQICREFTVLGEYLHDEDPTVNKSYETFLRNTEEKIDRVAHIGSDKNILVDRGHLSMMVNAFVEKHHNMSSTYDDALDWYMKRRAANSLVMPDMYVFVSAPRELVLERAKANGWYREDIGWLKDPDLALKAYEAFFSFLEPNVTLLRLDGRHDSTMLVEQFLARI